MIPGHTALGGIEQALGQLRAAETDANQRLDDVMRRLAEARTDEAEAYRDLAAFRLKSNDGLGGRLAQIATRVRAVLALRANDRTTLDKRLAAADAHVDKAAADRAAFAAELAEAEERRRAVENQAMVKLGEGGDYGAMRASVEQARHVAEEAERKAKLAEDERAAKSRPYEDDPLFRYLWERKYATQHYKAGNIARMLDGWVAKLVRYQDARPNYAMLTEIPKRLRDHANRTAALAVEAVEDLKEREKKAFLAVGGDKADANVAAKRRRLEELDAAREKAEKERDQVEHEIETFSRGEDPRYREALDLLAEALKSENLDALQRAAMATPAPEDDAIVRKIGASRDQQTGLDDGMKRIRGELAEISRRRSEIGQVASGFRQRRYDSDGSYFDDDVVGHLLRGLVTGVLSGSDYWSRMERGRRWNQPQSGPVVLPFPTGNSGGSVWGGGGSWGGGGPWGGGGGSSPSGGGDGFRTGGNF